MIASRSSQSKGFTKILRVPPMAVSPTTLISVDLGSSDCSERFFLNRGPIIYSTNSFIYSRTLTFYEINIYKLKLKVIELLFTSFFHLSSALSLNSSTTHELPCASSMLRVLWTLTLSRTFLLYWASPSYIKPYIYSFLLNPYLLLNKHL